MSIIHAASIRNTLADVIASATDASGNGKIKIYAGTLATLLAEFSLPSPPFGVVTGGVHTAEPITSVTASATGTAESFALTDGADNLVLQGTVGVAGSGADCILNTTALVTGGLVSISSFTYAAPS